jgi:hypothetical protein
VYIDPVRSDVNIGDSFTIFVKITDAVDVRTIQFTLRWNASVLNITDYNEGDFLSQGGVRDTYPLFKTHETNPSLLEPGTLLHGNTIQGTPLSGISGVGTMINATFVAADAGVTGLFLYDVHLADSFNNPAPVIMLEDGYVNMEPPMFAVEPSSIENAALVAGSTFSVNVTLIGAEDVLGFSFKLFYDRLGDGVLSATNVTAASFLNEPAEYETEINSTELSVKVNATSTAATGVTNDGVVATITFEVNAEGETVLDLADTLLNDRLARIKTPPVPHSPPAIDGYFSNIPIGHDVEVSQLLVSPTQLSAGGFVTINATITNIGGFDESVDVVAYHTGTTEITRQNGVTLTSGQRKSVLLIWDTTGVSPGSYTITVRANIADDADLDNNDLTYATAVKIEGGGGINLLLYAGIAAVVVIVVIVILYFVRFRKKS